MRSQRHVEHEWRNGRAVSVKNELLELTLAKAVKGTAVISARKLAEERKVSFEEAVQIRRREFVEKAAAIPKNKKNGSRYLRIARRRLATHYADAVVNAKVDHYYGLGAQLYNGLRIKFERCSGDLDQRQVPQAAFQTKRRSCFFAETSPSRWPIQVQTIFRFIESWRTGFEKV